MNDMCKHVRIHVLQVRRDVNLPYHPARVFLFVVTWSWSRIACNCCVSCATCFYVRLLVTSSCVSFPLAYGTMTWLQTRCVEGEQQVQLEVCSSRYGSPRVSTMSLATWISKGEYNESGPDPDHV